MCIKGSIRGSYRTTIHNFKLNFQYNTKVQYLPSMNITRSPYHFVHFLYIVGETFDTDYIHGDLLNFVVLNFFYSSTGRYLQ